MNNLPIGVKSFTSLHKPPMCKLPIFNGPTLGARLAEDRAAIFTALSWCKKPETQINIPDGLMSNLPNSTPKLLLLQPYPFPCIPSCPRIIFLTHGYLPLSWPGVCFTAKPNFLFSLLSPEFHHFNLISHSFSLLLSHGSCIIYRKLR